jgi:hypothetical protein
MDAKSFLMGSSNPGFSFVRPGDEVAGQIVGEPQVQQQRVFDPLGLSKELAFWPSGDPKMQMIVTLRTQLRNYEGISRPDTTVPDNGMRTLYVKGKHMESAMKQAILHAGAEFLDPGGMLQVRYTGDDYDSKAGIKPKLFAVRYMPPRQQAPASQPTPQGGQGYQQPQNVAQRPPQAVRPAPVQEDPWANSPAWGQPIQVTQPPHHEQGPMPDWAQPASVAPVSAQPVSVPASPAGMNTLEVLRAMQNSAPGNQIVQTDDIQPAF